MLFYVRFPLQYKNAYDPRDAHRPRDCPVPLSLSQCLEHQDPIGAGLVAALGDFLGALLFPIGTYFPGFTLTAFLTGCVYGFFLYKEQSWPRIIAAVGINQLILSLFLNTLWISILYGSPYGPLLATRLVQCLILTAVQLIGIPLIAKGLSHTVRKGRTS